MAMRRFFYLLFLFLPLFCSCERFDFDDAGNIITGDEVSVTFSVDQIEQTPFADVLQTRAVQLGQVCTRITLAIFRGEEKVKNINQLSSDAGFGTFTVGLTPGTYRIVALAHSGLGNPTVSTPEKITFASNKCTDTFYYYGEVQVSETASQSLMLKRAVAAFQFKTTEAIPDNVSKLVFYYTGGSSTFNAVSGYGCVNSKQTETFEVTAAMKGQPASFQVYTFPHADDGVLKMTVSALDATGETVCEKVFESLPVTLNRISCWEGSYFVASGSSQSNSLTLGIQDDGEWGGTIKVP